MKTKTALISGVTSGIGRAAVFQLLKDGFFVSAFAPDKRRCQALAKELALSYTEESFLIQVGDVRKEDTLKKIVQKTIRKFKTIDVLVNNAGYGYYSSADEVDIEKYQDMIDVNLVGIARLTKLVVPIMKKRRQGLVINIASVAGKTAGPKGEFYSSTKFGVMGFSEGLRKELNESGVKVSTVCPGMVRTGFLTKEEYKRRMRELWHGKEPVMLDASDIGRVVSFICQQPPQSDIQDIVVMPFD